MTATMKTGAVNADAVTAEERLHIRTAQADDVGLIAELMYSSGPDIYDYLYQEKALDFLRYEFASGRGFAGHPHVTVAVRAGEVVGTGCFYGRRDYERLLNGTVKNMTRFFGYLGVVPVLFRSRHLKSVMRAPRPGELYLSNFGVSPQQRSQGIGSQMIQHKLQQAREQGYDLFGLDVSVANPRGQALYSRLGLQVTQEKTFSNPRAGVNPARKMELALLP
ncbi:MAG: GNAT family N-acetyltransferase [Ketobacter sp.]|nr:MAG: GNAT family N-acetyltransferase [Ketobacter sp.]